MHRHLLLAAAVLLAGAVIPRNSSAGGALQARGPWAPSQMLKPEDLVREMSDPQAKKPAIIHVGFRNLYTIGHIPGSR